MRNKPVWIIGLPDRIAKISKQERRQGNMDRDQDIGGPGQGSGQRGVGETSEQGPHSPRFRTSEGGRHKKKNGELLKETGERLTRTVDRISPARILCTVFYGFFSSRALECAKVPRKRELPGVQNHHTGRTLFFQLLRDTRLREHWSILTD